MTDLTTHSREDKRKRTRMVLLDAAAKLWAERGIRGASLDDVAAAAGLTKGAVYSNFASKTDLVLALLDRCAAEDLGLTICRAPAGNDLSPDDDKRLLSLLLVEFWLFGMRDYTAACRVADWYESMRDGLASRLGDAKDLSAADRATLAVAIDFGLAIQHLLDPDRVDAELYGVGMRLLMGGT